METQTTPIEKRKTFIFWFVLILLLLSVIYAAIMLVLAPSGVPENEYTKVKSDYVLMILQCVVGAVVIFLPSKVERWYGVDIPDMMEILYFLFLFAAIYLGEVQDFYYRVPYWDVILHGFSAVMLGALGFVLVNFLNSAERLYIKLTPFFVAFFAFCFSMTCGTVWEIYEFFADGILGTNMQKFITAKGEILSGREAIADTMEDIIVDAIGTLLITTIGYFNLKRRQKKLKRDLQIKDL